MTAAADRLACCRWKLAELPAVNDFILLLRDKVLDGLVQFADPLLAAITLCSKVRRKLQLSGAVRGSDNSLRCTP